MTLENTCEYPNNDSMCALCVNNGIIVRLIVKICVRVLWQLKKLGTRFKSDGGSSRTPPGTHGRALEDLPGTISMCLVWKNPPPEIKNPPPRRFERSKRNNTTNTLIISNLQIKPKTP